MYSLLTGKPIVKIELHFQNISEKRKTPESVKENKNKCVRIIIIIYYYYPNIIIIIFIIWIVLYVMNQNENQLQFHHMMK